MIIYGEAKDLFSALVKAQSDFKVVVANKAGYNYKYADLESVIAASRPALAENGLTVVQSVSTDTFEKCIGVSVETFIAHESGAYAQFPALVIPLEKTDPRSIGSATTYARRYSYMSALGIAPEDDDAASAQPPMPSKAPKESRPFSDRREAGITWSVKEGAFSDEESAALAFDDLHAESSSDEDAIHHWVDLVNSKIS